MTKIKICGITNLGDAELAADLGADALGFNFYPKSPRFTDAATVAKIARRLSASVGMMGVFVNERIDTVATTAEKAGIDTVQLHGDETPEYCAELRNATGLKVMKAFRMGAGFRAATPEAYDVDLLLLDADAGPAYGGSGAVADWQTAAVICSERANVYLAGGLSPENVRRAVETVKPFGVDACSCLESEKGNKDAAKLRAFFHAVRSAK